MVFKKQRNEQGNYVGQDGKRYEILACNVTESMEYVQIGTDTQMIDGETVESPVYERQIVINKGWDKYASEEAAARAYGFTYDPLPDEVTA